MIPSRGQQKTSPLRRKGEFPFKSQRWFCLHSPNVGPRIFQWPAWMVAVMVRISSWNSRYELLVWIQKITSWHSEKRLGTIFFIFIIIFFIIVIIILILPFSMLPFRLCLEASLGLSRYLTNAIGIRGAPAESTTVITGRHMGHF